MARKSRPSTKGGKKPAGKGGSARPKAKPRPAAAKPPPRPPAKKAEKAPPKAAKAPPKAPAKVAKAGPAPAAAAPPAKATPAAILAAKALKKARAAKKPAVPKAAPRLKIVWAVCDHTLKTLKTFPYPERRAAELEAERLQKAKGKEHVVRAERVPMTAQPEARR